MLHKYLLTIEWVPLLKDCYSLVYIHRACISRGKRLWYDIYLDMLLFELNCVVLSHLLRSPLSRAQLAAMHLRIFITLGEVILGRSMYSLTSLLHSVIKGVRRKTDHTGLMVFLHLIVFALFFPLPRILFCQVCK